MRISGLEMYLARLAIRQTSVDQSLSFHHAHYTSASRYEDFAGRGGTASLSLKKNLGCARLGKCERALFGHTTKKRVIAEWHRDSSF